jgi:hypothetical protein
MSQGATAGDSELCMMTCGRHLSIPCFDRRMTAHIIIPLISNIFIHKSWTHLWNQNDIEKRCRRSFPVMPDLTSYAFHPGFVPNMPWRPPSLTEEDVGDFPTFLRALGQWIQYDDPDVEPACEWAALENNFPETDG